MGLVGTALRLVARRRLAKLRALALSPMKAQERELDLLLQSARRTAFGRDHGLDAVRTHADWKAAVPLRDYAGLAPYWDRARDGEPDVAWPGRIRYWAISSGTTAGEKYLPVSEATIRGNKKGGFDSMVPHLAEGGGDPFGGKLLFLGGCTELRRHGPASDAIWIGDNTGIMTLHMPKLIRRWHVPSPEIARIADWEQKIARAATETVDADVRMLSGVPSWIVLFGEGVLAEAKSRGIAARSLRDVWPNLSLFVHGGVAFQPYRQRFLELAGNDIRCTDTYSASEGGMLAVQDLKGDAGMLPLVDQGVFFEFVPASELQSDAPIRHHLGEVQPGIDYAVALNTDSGIYAYLVGDLVRFTSTSPLRLVFAGRIAHTLNAFGEHVSGGELDRAISEAAEEASAEIAEFSVAAEYPEEKDEVGGHVYYVEFRREPPEVDVFAAAIDRILQQGNEDYATHRTFGLRPPRIRPVPAGGFYAWMRARGKFGGQNKVPRVLAPELEKDFVRSLTG